MAELPPIPEPPDGTRIEWEHHTDVYAAWRDDESSRKAGWTFGDGGETWVLFPESIPRTWRSLLEEFGESLALARHWVVSPGAEPDPRTVHVPADATVHLHRQDEARVTVDDFGPGSPTVAVMRASYGGQAAALAELGAELERVRGERDRLLGMARRLNAALETERADLAAWREYRDLPPTASLAELIEAEREATRLAVGFESLRSTPDAPTGPLSAPVAAQDPPAGGIGPTQAQRGAEGVRQPSWRWRPPSRHRPAGWEFVGQGDEQAEADAEAIREALSKLDGSTASSISLLTGIPVERLAEFGAMPPAVDTVSGASERREGER